MKINANENVLLMNKKVRKMGAEPTPTPETPVSNPENTIKAMDVMGQQNIAFQGGMSKLANGKFAKTAMGVAASFAALPQVTVVPLAALAAFAALATSCVKQEQIVNLGELAAAIAALQTEISNFRAEQAGSNATIIELLRFILNKMQEMYASQNAFYEKSENFYAELIETVLNYLGEDSPLYNKITEILKHCTNSEEAYKQIINLLTNIDANVEAILKEAKSFNSKMEKSLENQEKYYAEYKEFCEKCYAAILAGNMTLEEFKNQSLEKYGEIVGAIVNNNSLISALMELVDNGFSTSEQNQNRLINIGQNLTELQAATLEQSIRIGNDIMLVYSQMLKESMISQAQYNQMKNFLNNWYDAYSENSANTAQYEKQVLNEMSTLITTVANGDASILAKLDEILNSNMSTNEKLDAMNEVLKNIDANVESIMKTINEFIKTYNKFFSEYKNSTSEIKQLLKEVRNGVKDISVNVANIRQKIGSSLSGLEAQLKNIAALIVKADANNVAALTEGKEEIISVLETLGYNQTEILNMTMQEVKAAIEKGNQYVQNNGTVLSKILSFVAILPQIRDAGYTTNTKIDKIINKLNNLEIGVEISPETLAELEAFFEANFDEFKDLLNDINNNITKQGENISDALKKVNANVTVIKGDVNEIKENSAILIAYNQYILEAIKEFKEENNTNLVNIEEIAAQIGVDVAWIRAHGGGGSGSTVDLTKIENYLKQMFAEQEATNVKLDLLIALQSKDSDKFDEMLKYIKSMDSTTKSILDEEKNFKDIVITAFAAFGIQLDEANEWLEKIYNKKCNCAKDVTIIVEKIYKYLVGNEGIVDYDKLFDDLFGDEGTNAVAMASTPKSNSADINRLIMADNSMHLRNTIRKVTTGRPLNNGVYTMGNIAYTVSGDLDKTMPVADFYKFAERIASEPTYKELKKARHFNDPQMVAKRNAQNNKTYNA